MATQTVYLASSVSGSAATPNDALGAPNGSTVANNLTGWAGVANSNTSWTHRWKFTAPTNIELASSNQVMTVKVRKGSNTGNPSVSAIRIYQGGTQIYSDTTVRTITNSTTGQTFDVTWTGSGSSQDIDIEVVTAGVGGSGSARNSVMLDSVTWVAQLVDETPNTPPVSVARFSDGTTSKTININTYVDLVGTASYDPDGSIVSYQWFSPFGDAQFINPSSATASVRFTTTGIKRVGLEVTDNLGAKASSELYITVQDMGHPPVVNAGNDRSMLLGDVTALNAVAYDLENDIVSTVWSVQVGPDLSDAQFADKYTLATNFTPTLSGYYELKITVTDAYNNVGSDTLIVNVTSPPVLVVDGGLNQEFELSTDHIAIDLTQSYAEGIGYIADYTATQNIPLSTAEVELIVIDAGIWWFYPPSAGVYIFDVGVWDNEYVFSEDTLTIEVYDGEQPAPGVYIWEGGQQLPATLSIWEGGVEVPIVLDAGSL